MDDKQLLALIGRVDVEMPGVPMAGLLRDAVKVSDYQARLLAMARAVQAAERGRWEKPAFLWPVAMPDEVARWVSANPPQVVPRDEMQRVEWPNAGAMRHARKEDR